MRPYIVELLQKTKRSLLNLNLFPSVPPSVDEHQLHNQRISTRVFIFLLLSSLTILILYTSLINITQTITIDLPTVTKYDDLYSKYSQALSCPCTQVSIGYDKILHVAYVFHEVCSSVYVTQAWIDYLSQFTEFFNLTSGDFRATSIASFQALSGICQLVNETVSNRLSEFYSTQYVTASVVSRNVFESQTKAFVSQFISTMTNDFLLSLSVIRDTTQANGLFSGQFTNYELIQSNVRVFPVSNSYGNCMCYSSARCTSPSRIININTNTVLFTVPGFYIGCYIIESLLQSDFRCFYDQICLDLLRFHLSLFTLLDATILNSSLLINSNVNSTIEDLLNQLMVEKWTPSLMFESYYNECRPEKCLYTVEAKNSVIYIVTTMIGLVGGLIKVFKLVVPRLVQFIRRKKPTKRESEVSDSVQKSSILQTYKHHLCSFNLFPSIPPSVDEQRLYEERITTRFFIILLLISLTILILYTSLIDITQTDIVSSPTMTEYGELYSIYSQRLICPCTKISNNYGAFVQLNYTFHQLCSSALISQSWIEYLAPYSGRLNVTFIDFRALGTFIFQGLRGFCNSASQVIANRLMEFYSTQYVTASVISKEVFNSQMKSLTTQFISTMINDFLLSYSAIRFTTQANSLVSGQLTNYFLVQRTDYYFLSWAYITYNCTCSSSARCSAWCGIVDPPTSTIFFRMPGIKSGCYIIEALLQSDLRCFYDQTCINQLQSYLRLMPPINITALDKSLPSNFSSNSSIAELLGHLMVEQWTPLIVYEKYYHECQPYQCVYIYKTKNSVIGIITIIIGLIGGLITALRLITPRLVMFFRYKEIPERPQNVTNINEKSRELWRKLKDFIVTFNLFPSIPPSVDEHQLHNQRISTRVFIFLLLSALTILILYTSLINITQTITIDSPTVTKYDELYSKYSQALSCPCTQVSIAYDKILHVAYVFHEVCSSVYVTKVWTDYLDASNQTGGLYSRDFRSSGTFAFQALIGICQLVNETISNRLTEFYSTQYVTASVVSRIVFESQVEAFISQFISTMTNDFLLLVSTIRGTTQANALLSAGIPNYLLFMAIDTGAGAAESYGNGNCYTSAKWTDPSTFMKFPSGTVFFTVPGFYIGCYIIESLLQSDLRCFYDQICLTQLLFYISPWAPLNLITLDKSLLVRSFVNSTIENLMNQLMVEQWTPSPMFENYYSECMPTKCAYTIETKSTIIYIITVVIGLIGGLTTALKLIVPRLVQFFAFCIRKWRTKRHRIVPIIEQ
ncbi:unnamed protein product [Adineta ricciae]|uniref:Uncharacterized protein n=1 Tax=Adineta ricciae TaxID=249248 RepID=A0A814RY74_ADIRI|nr:unnamed protein product [Adineta ricciae]